MSHQNSLSVPTSVGKTRLQLASQPVEEVTSSYDLLCQIKNDLNLGLDKLYRVNYAEPSGVRIIAPFVEYALNPPKGLASQINTIQTPEK